MAKVKFSSSKVEGFKCEDGKSQSFLWDATAPGLGLRAAANGNKSYVFQAKLNKVAVRITIGALATWDISSAQAEARRLKVMMDGGLDPRIQKAETLADQAAKRETSRQIEAPALDAWTVYVAARTQRWSERTLLDHQRLTDPGGKLKSRGRKKDEGETTLPGILLPLLTLPLKHLDSDRVREWLQTERHRATVAMNAFVRLRAFLNWCETKAEYRHQVQPSVCTTAVAKDELPKPSVKNDCLQREQLPLWFREIRKLSNPVASAYLQCLLLTGARREEMAELRWEDIDFRWGSMTIRDKVEETRTIPLTPYVAALLDGLPRLNQWVFSSRTAESGRIQEPRKAHNGALAAAELPHLTIHGLRRSFRTLSEWVECPVGIAAQIQGHKPSAIAEKHYIRRPLDLLRMWHIKIESWIIEQAEIEFCPAPQRLRSVA